MCVFNKYIYMYMYTIVVVSSTNYVFDQNPI